MNFMALFFLCVRMFHFIHADSIHYFMQNIARILDKRKENPDARQVIVIDGSSSIVLAYLIADFFFLLYCIFLMLHQDTWTPGFLLLTISALEPVAISSRISGTYIEDIHGFIYPRTWFRYLTFGESMFILLRLFEG